LAAAKRRGEDVGKPDGTGQRVFTPRNFREAKQSPQWELWHDAMLEEMDSLESHGTWDYAVKTSDMKVIPCHWVYALKTDSDGQVNRYKARLVADGNRQILGLDVNEIYAPTASFAARRVLLSVAAARDMEVHQVDIKTAFLNGDLEEDVYMRHSCTGPVYLLHSDHKPAQPLSVPGEHSSYHPVPLTTLPVCYNVLALAEEAA
jgi:hypothetical protein